MTAITETAGMTIAERAEWIARPIWKIPAPREMRQAVCARAIVALSETLALGTSVIPHEGIVNADDRRMK